MAERKQDESVKAASEVGADEVQATFDEAADKGYFGETVDETPRDEFTVRGVSKKS